LSQHLRWPATMFAAVVFVSAYKNRLSICRQTILLS
jgi:ribosome-associated toxin RatA of RatAB toxin-antitoxin module